jgi:hypothetical protein
MTRAIEVGVLGATGDVGQQFVAPPRPIARGFT